MNGALKNTKIKLVVLAIIKMLLIVEEGIIDRICCPVYRYTKAKNEYTKIFDKRRDSSYQKKYIRKMTCK